ncbi:MAG: VWA domain-containing protein [Planctomycetes bacterium]|nr:VWA domain-containing protein [Planctomycetota bacterium]
MSKTESAPELHLEFTEEFFGKFWKKLSEKNARLPFEDFAASFSELETSLSTVAQAFAGKHLIVRRAEAAGGIHDNVILMPRLVALTNDHLSNRDFFFARAAIAGAMVKYSATAAVTDLEYLRLAFTTARALANAYPGSLTRINNAAQLELGCRPKIDCEIEDLRKEVLRCLSGSPIVEPQWPFAIIADKKSPQILLLGGLLKQSEIDSSIKAISDEELAAQESQVTTEVDAPLKDHVKLTQLNEDGAKEDMPEHAFEKVMFAEKSDDGERRIDGEDDMEDQQDSLDAVDLREIVRGGPEVHSIYKADIGDAGNIPNVEQVESNERALMYDEWNQKTRSYLHDWVAVYPTIIDDSAPEYTRELAAKLKSTTQRAIRDLECWRTERQWRDRQLDGDTIDIPAMVDDHALRAAGQQTTGRVYKTQPRVERDVATVLLLDMSLSADGWVNNRRVLDIEREAAFVLGEVTEKLGDQLSIIAYASKTRNLCRAYQVKSWQDNWSRAKHRLGVLTPQGYTRIGPAVRHAIAEFDKNPARKMNIILATDAKPTDFDKYEGAYGIHDVRQAVREARGKGINVHALGIDPSSASILPVMFGVQGWQLLRDISELPKALMSAYGNFS